jgi:hypothetical protein
MTYLLPSYFLNLGLDQTATERDIKRAYAAKLRTIDQATQAAAFGQLRQDYEAALNHVKNGWGFLQIEGELDTDLDTSISEPEISAQEVPSQEEVREKVPTQTPEQLLAQFAQNLKAFSPSNTLAIATLLHKTLENPDLIGLQARQDFELGVMRELAKREHSDDTLFGMHSLAVLLAAKERYDWEQSTTPMPSFYQNGFGYVQSLLDQTSLISSGRLEFWLSLTTAPTLAQARYLKQPIPDNAGGGTPQLRHFVFGIHHLDQWRIALEASHPVRTAWAKLKRHPLYPNWLFWLLRNWRWLIFIVFVGGVLAQCTNELLNSKQKKAQELVMTTPACDGTYGNLISRNWNQVSSNELSAVWQCMQTTQPPQMCQDRSAAAELFARQVQIIKTDSSVELWKYNIGSADWVFNSSETPSYSFATSVSCPARWTVAANTAWLGVPDLSAAKNMVTLLYYCKDSVPPQSQSFAALLKRTDVWMDLALEKKSSIRIPLRELVRAAPMPTADLVKQDHWQACHNTLDMPYRFREKELAAVRARAQIKP